MALPQQSYQAPLSIICPYYVLILAAEVPLHTHKGLEITLVLAGEMVDEMGRYAAGDLIINTPDHTHTPRNLSDEPCLCLSVLTAPLEFKQGLTRLLNPLQRFFLINNNCSQISTIHLVLIWPSLISSASQCRP